MKLKSTADGLKAQPINPHEYGFYVNLVTNEKTEYEDWAKFDKENPELPLTKPMPGNTVFEGVEVWQARYYHPELPGWGDWLNCTKEHAKWGKDKFTETRRCYQPLEVKEQVREEADNVYGMNELDIDKVTNNENVIALKKASNPELGVEEAAESWLEEQGGANGNIAPDFIRSFIAGANWQATQQQGLVSLESVINLFENRIAELQEMQLSKLESEHLINEDEYMLGKLKTLKQ